jgi:hypothetical protein
MCLNLLIVYVSAGLYISSRRSFRSFVALLFSDNRLLSLSSLDRPFSVT